ncbi:unnamed protein product, partial [Ectocarpus sp. 12 AP-2014]
VPDAAATEAVAAALVDVRNPRRRTHLAAGATVTAAYHAAAVPGATVTVAGTPKGLRVLPAAVEAAPRGGKGVPETPVEPAVHPRQGRREGSSGNPEEGAAAVGATGAGAPGGCCCGPS